MKHGPRALPSDLTKETRKEPYGPARLEEKDVICEAIKWIKTNVSLKPKRPRLRIYQAGANARLQD